MRREEHRGSARKAVRNLKATTGSRRNLLPLSRDRHEEFDRKGLVSTQRSAMMARIGPRDTAPELAVRRVLHRLGARFRLHRRDLPGTPDIVLPRRKIALLVHGCFWHRHAGCRLTYMPKTRTAFWSAKFARNVARDREVRRMLKALGWKVHVMWECDTRNVKTLERQLRRILGLGSC